MNPTQLFWQGDALTRGVAVLLLAMSVSTWVVILWKSWLLRRASLQVARSIAAFWQAHSTTQAAQLIQRFDAFKLVLPLLQASTLELTTALGASVPRQQQLTRLLRQALNQSLRKLQFGQVLLASVGSTAPFVGLLGTVWGIYHALMGIAAAGQITIDKIAAPVGESLVMTGAGLVVAIPAVLAFNVFGRSAQRIEHELEGFALDLREFFSQPEPLPTGSDQSAPGHGVCTT